MPAVNIATGAKAPHTGRLVARAVVFKSGSATLHAIAARAEPTQRARHPLLLDRFPVVARAADAVSARAVEAQRTAAPVLLKCTTNVATLGRHAVAAGGVVAQRTPSHFWEGLEGCWAKALIGRRARTPPSRAVRSRWRWSQLINRRGFRSRASMNRPMEPGKPNFFGVYSCCCTDRLDGLNMALSTLHDAAEPCRFCIQVRF